MSDEIYDLAIKIDATMTAHEFMSFMDDFEPLTTHIFWNTVEHDEKCVYMDIQYEKENEKKLVEFLKNDNRVDVDIVTMAEWL